MRFAVQHAVGDSAWVPGILAPDAVSSFARQAEASGFDALGFTDHPAPSTSWIERGGEGVADPFVSLAFCAAVTTRIRLLTFVLVPAYRNPLVIAHQLATLDVLSAGRVTVGLGTGYLFGEFKALGLDAGDRLRAFDEGVEVMRRAWTGRSVVPGSGPDEPPRNRVLPDVVQRPHPPLWIHGNSPFGTRRAARYGAGWLGMMTPADETLVRTTRTTPLPDMATLARRIEEVRREAAAAGRDPSEVEIVVAGAWPMLDIRSAKDGRSHLDSVAQLEAMGCDWVVSLCCGDDPAVANDTIAWFGEEVIAPYAAR